MSHPKSEEAQGRLRALDGFRGVAICALLLTHGFYAGSHALNLTLVTKAIGGMWMTVDMFFALSGYLITGILLREKEHPQYFRNFYARRSLRIFPAYFFVLAIIFFVLPLLSQPLRDADLARTAPYLLVYLQNLVWSVPGAEPPWLGIGHFWTLAIEEQFYAFWPLIVYLVSRQRLVWICAGLFAMACGLKLIALGMDLPFNSAYNFTLTRIDSLAAGAWVSTLPRVQTPELRRFTRIMVAIAVALLLVVIVYKHSLYLSSFATTFASPAAGILSAAVIMGIHQKTLRGPLKAVLEARVFNWFGQYSYGLYLLHWPIFVIGSEWISRSIPNPGSHEFAFALLVLGFVMLVLCMIAAPVMYRLLEEPCLKYGARFHYVPPRDKTPAPAAP